ncbi:bifunctional oligoribonuclease/PAP phosphatase NrnA [bacterium]|nr:bifunctional oligoribonuclease/PAP phosphatase NrnA [bacterium]
MSHTTYPYTNPQLLDEIIGQLRGARFVQIIGHVNPDGDCVGSMLAMHHLLAMWGVPHALAAQKIGPGGYDQLAGFELIGAAPSANAGLVVYLDTATIERGIEGWTPVAPIINIDHHAGNTRFGALNWIEPRFAATGEMVYHLAARAGVEPTVEMANNLLLAITTDTGSFRYSNTGADQHRVAANLIEAGASPQLIAGIAYDSQPLESLRITGHVLSNMRIEAGGRLAWSELRLEEVRPFGGPANAPENLVSLLRSVRGVRVCLLFHELESGRVRVNFRSDGSYDVSRLAAQWGGGGHECAAGLMVRNSPAYDQTRDEILAAAIKFLQ